MCNILYGVTCLFISECWGKLSGTWSTSDSEFYGAKAMCVGTAAAAGDSNLSAIFRRKMFDSSFFSARMITSGFLNLYQGHSETTMSVSKNYFPNLKSNEEDALIIDQRIDIDTCLIERRVI